MLLTLYYKQKIVEYTYIHIFFYFLEYGITQKAKPGIKLETFFSSFKNFIVPI